MNTVKHHSPSSGSKGELAALTLDEFPSADERHDSPVPEDSSDEESAEDDPSPPPPEPRRPPSGKGEPPLRIELRYELMVDVLESRRPPPPPPPPPGPVPALLALW